MDLSNIRKIGKKKKKPKRLGRGIGTGTGKTSGRGHKGAGQRKGKKLPYAGFRGGNLPLARILPKRGFTSLRKMEYQIVNLRDIQKRAGKEKEINPEVLKKLKLIKNEKKPIKVLAVVEGELTNALVIKVDKISLKAKELVVAAGGRVECLSR